MATDINIEEERVWGGRRGKERRENEGMQNTKQVVNCCRHSLTAAEFIAKTCRYSSTCSIFRSFPPLSWLFPCSSLNSRALICCVLRVHVQQSIPYDIYVTTTRLFPSLFFSIIVHSFIHSFIRSNFSPCHPSRQPLDPQTKSCTWMSGARSFPPVCPHSLGYPIREFFQ